MEGLRILRRVALPVLVATATFVVGGFSGTTPTAHAYSAISQEKGLDACAAPSSSTMNTWWVNSPYWNMGVYIGGSNRGCAQPNLTSSWVSTVQGQGWGLLPIWVGPQMANGTCTTRTYNTYISLNTTTAYNQGYSEGSSAYSAAVGLGFDVSAMPIIYDLEAYNGNSSCRAAAKSFLNGWDAYLHLAPAQKAGVYGSACSSYLDDFSTIANVPDFIWFAYWNGNPSTSNITCVNTGHLVYNQRHKQYQGGHNETYGGVAINMDNDCSNGPVYYTAARFDSGSGCP
jgi:hypothetical protein